MTVESTMIVELEQWFQTPAGQYALAWEQAQVDGMVANAFGYQAWQVGLGSLDWLRANRIPYRACCAVLAGHAEPVQLVADPAFLPFDAQSIDLLVLPHVLEYAADPHQVLREVARVLVPEGRVVVTGFNPWSLWGLRERMPALDPLLPVPAHAQVSLARLKDWFKLLDLSLDRGRYGVYVPSCRTTQWLERWRFMEAAGDRWWPVCGALYAVSAVKRVAGLRMVQPSWRRARRRSRRQAAAVSTREGEV